MWITECVTIKPLTCGLLECSEHDNSVSFHITAGARRRCKETIKNKVLLGFGDLRMAKCTIPFGATELVALEPLCRPPLALSPFLPAGIGENKSLRRPPQAAVPS